MPVLFVGHGSPMNAIEQNKFSKIWRGLAKKITNSKSDYGSIGPLGNSWYKSYGNENPGTINDFGGFSKALHDAEYTVPGSPECAKATSELLAKWKVYQDYEWGLDHGR